VACEVLADLLRETYEGPGFTWSNLRKNRLVKQKLKVISGKTGWLNRN